jgi:hypothetical protein
VVCADQLVANQSANHKVVRWSPRCGAARWPGLVNSWPPRWPGYGQAWAGCAAHWQAVRLWQRRLPCLTLTSGGSCTPWCTTLKVPTRVTHPSDYPHGVGRLNSISWADYEAQSSQIMQSVSLVPHPWCFAR